MSTTVCSRCEASYQGWRCPNCYATDKHREVTEAASDQLARTLGRNAELQQEAAARLAKRIAEEQEATRRSHEEASYRMEMATAEAARQHTHAIANSWKLEARAKADRAYELYRADLYSEAIALARRALQQDPGNLSAYKTAAWSMEALENHQEAKGLYEKQLNLLGMPDYRSSEYSFATVLDGLPPDESLLDRAQQVFHELIDSWALDDDTNYLLEQLCERKWPNEVANLIQRLTSRTSGGRLLPHLATLRGAGYQEEAYDLARTLARTEPSLAHHAWSIELGGTSQRDVRALEEWLASIPATSRAELAKQAAYLRENQASALAGGTVTALREAIARRRQTWQGDVAMQFSNQASETSRCARALESHLATVPFISRPTPAGCLTFVLVGIGLLGLFGVFPSANLVDLGCGILFFVAIGSLVLWFALKQKAVGEIYRSSYNELWHREETTWHDALQV